MSPSPSPRRRPVPGVDGARVVRGADAAVVAQDRRAQRRTTAAVVGLGLSLGAAAAFVGALLQPRRRGAGYDPRRPR